MSGVGTDVDRRALGTRAAAELAALVRESVAANAVRDVLHLRMGALAPELRRPHHQRLLRSVLEPLMAAARTRVFDLPNGDVVAVAPPPALGLETARLALMRALESSATDVVRAMRLPDEAAQLLAVTAQSLGLDPEQNPPVPPRPRGVPIASNDVVTAERAISQADLEPVTMVQAVCRLDPEGGPARLVWEDRRLKWEALAEAVLPGVDIGSSPDLQRRLARSAELRLLAELVRPLAQRSWRPIGLLLTPATILSGGFGRFEAALPAGRRESVTIGISPRDALADPAGFVAARDLARGHGFRLALDDAPATLLPLLPPGLLGIDVLRLRWSAELPGIPGPAIAALLGREGNAPEVVLTGVDRPAAIAWGWEIGIALFQGPLVERRREG